MDDKHNFYELVVDQKGSTDDKIAYYNGWSKGYDNVSYFFYLILVRTKVEAKSKFNWIFIPHVNYGRPLVPLGKNILSGVII